MADATKVFVCNQAPNLKTAFDGPDGERMEVAFKGGRLELAGEELAAFEKALASKGASRLRQMVREVNYEEAEALVAQHKALQPAGAAVKGPFDTSHRAQMLGIQLEASAALNQGANPDEMRAAHQEAFGDSGLEQEPGPGLEALKQASAEADAAAAAAIEAQNEAASEAGETAKGGLAALAAAQAETPSE